jgi:hypothetical protein
MSEDVKKLIFCILLGACSGIILASIEKWGHIPINTYVGGGVVGMLIVAGMAIGDRWFKE